MVHGSTVGAILWILGYKMSRDYFFKITRFLEKFCLRVSIANFYQLNHSKGMIYILQHFKKATADKILSHSSIYKVLVRFDLNGNINRIKKCVQEINPEIITNMFKILSLRYTKPMNLVLLVS